MGAFSAPKAGRLRPGAVYRARLWRLVRNTVATCFRYRVTGLAAEAGFFALLSLPPLILGLVGTLGYLVDVIGQDTVDRVRAEIIRLAGRALSARSVQDVLVPTLDDVLQRGRFEIVSFGFLVSLWSGSRVLNVFIDTVSIMYGLAGRRGIIRQRALSFGLYVIGLLLGIVLLPLVLTGPSFVARVVPDQIAIVGRLYWPVVVLLSIAFLATLYHVSIPVRVEWRRAVPGAALTLVLWVVFSYLLRVVISASVGGASIYGPLAASIVLLVWLYALAIAVLIGAALNAAADRLWPVRATTQARESAPSAEDDVAKIPLTPVHPRR